jgi:YVTN family beta-propeller protein
VADVFLSYSRRDGAFVQRLGSALRERGKEVWVDVEGIRDAEVFPEALRRAVESSDGFVFVISPDSVGSSFCVEEVEHAASLNKRIVPIALRPVTDEEVPEGVRVRNWIPAGEAWDFETTINRVLRALDTDLEWERQHSRLTVKAIEWEQSGRNRSFLLRGADLKSAERWLSAGAEKDPGPTALEREYLAASRSRVRRGRALATATGAVVVAGLAALAALRFAPGAGVHVGPNSLAAIDPRTNKVVGSVPVGTRPGAVTFGFGSLWVANQDDQTISRVDPGSLQTLGNITLPNPPTGLAAGAGAIWVAQADPAEASVSLSAIDPQFNNVGPARRFATLYPGDTAAVATQGATVWLAPGSGDLTQLDASTTKILRHIDPNSGPTAIAVGDGAVWLTDPAANTVTRVAPTGPLKAIPVGNGPGAVAVGAGGVWVADSLDDSIKQIDPSTQSASTTIPVGRSPVAVSVGAGSVWVANSGDGTVTRIDPRTDKVLAKIAVGGSPQAITIARGRVWVTVAPQTIKPTQATSGGNLRVEMEDGVDYMDPALAYSPQSWQLLYATCAKLLNYPDKSGAAGQRLTPELAQSLPAVSGDGKTYTFTIRPGFRFPPPVSQPVTAQTFKRTIERTLNPAMKSPISFGLDNVVGAATYIAGKATQISGVVARGDILTIHLLKPEPDITSRLAQPFFCVVPPDTPINRKGVPVVPSAGPYYVTSYTPGRAVVLARNPNYHGNRPHRFDRIEVALGISSQEGVSDIKAGTADYTTIAGPPAAAARALASRLAAQYGSVSPGAARPGQRYFVTPLPELDFYVLNTHRPLFSNVRLREAVNYAVDRRALAAVGTGYSLDDNPTSQYLPPGLPGSAVQPPLPDLVKARGLAQGHGRTAVLFTCNTTTCEQQAQILTNDLAAIDLHVNTKTLPQGKLIALLATPGARFDLAYAVWITDYPDPGSMLSGMLDNPSSYPTFNDPYYQQRLAAAGRLSGPERYLANGKLAADLARDAAPLIPYGNPTNHEFFSARIGCQTYTFYVGADLAALCTKHG